MLEVFFWYDWIIPPGFSLWWLPAITKDRIWNLALQDLSVYRLSCTDQDFDA